MPDPRINFAAERTLLAWLRTGLAMMGFGFVVARFGLFLNEIEWQRGGTAGATHGLPPTLGTSTHFISVWLGAALVALGVVVDLAAAARYRRIVQRLRAGEEDIAPSPGLALTVATILALIGVAMTAYVLTAGH